MKQNSERLTKSNVDVIMVAIGDDVDDDECQYVTCGSHPIINIAPEQNPRAVVYSIVGELEEGWCYFVFWGCCYELLLLVRSGAGCIKTSLKLTMIGKSIDQSH